MANERYEGIMRWTWMYVNKWVSYARHSEDIQLPDEPLFDFSWVEDNYELIIEWIINEYFKGTAEKHLDCLNHILLTIDKIKYRHIPNLLSDAMKRSEDMRKREEKLEYAKNYRHEKKLQIKEQRAKHYENNKESLLCKKFLENLNNGKTTKPRESTLQRYNIHHDGEKWISNLNMA